jgi:DNA-binding response OmpR family regulator
MKAVEQSVLIKTAATLRRMGNEIQALEKRAQDSERLLEAIEICEKLEKRGYLTFDDSEPMVERAEAILKRKDYEKLANLAEHGGKAYKTAQLDNMAAGRNDGRSAAERRLDNTILYGSKHSLEDL